MLTWARQRYHMFRLPAAARRQARADRAGPSSADPGAEAAIADLEARSAFADIGIA